MAKTHRYLLQRARGGDLPAARELARDNTVKPETLDELAQSADTDTRVAVAANTGTPSQALQRLIYDADVLVSAAVAARADLSTEMRQALTLRATAEHIVRRGRERAAILDLVIALCNHADTTEVELQHFLSSIPTAQLPRLLARDCTNPLVHETLAHHRKATVRQHLAANPHLTAPTLEVLAEDDNDKVRLAAIARLEALQVSESTDLRPDENCHEAGVPVLDESRNGLVHFHGGEGEFQEILNFFLSAPASGQPILEYGCGSGHLTASLVAANHEKLTAVDTRSTAIERTRALIGDTDGVIAREVPAEEPLPFPDNSFTSILSRNALDFEPDIPFRLHDLVRVLTPGGTIALTASCFSEAADDDALDSLMPFLQRIGIDYPHQAELYLYLGTTGLIVDLMDPSPRLRTALIPSSERPNPQVPQEVLDAIDQTQCNTQQPLRGEVCLLAHKAGES